MNYSREYNKECRLLAEIQAKIFKQASDNSLPSYFFIKVFMHSEYAVQFDSLSLLSSYTSTEELFINVAKKVKKNRGEVYNPKEMSWIGYFYRTFCYLYNVASHVAFDLIPVSHLKKAYLMYHTQDIRKAIQWVIDDLNITFEDKQKKIFDILRTIV